MSFPYLDVGGFSLRTTMTPEDVSLFTSRNPGFVEARIALRTSYINSRLRKRYGSSATLGNSLPLGQQAPPLVASGISPPPVSLSGRPTLGSLRMLLQITTPGTLGTAFFQWSQDGGRTFVGPLPIAPISVLGTTGLSATFPAGAYGIDNLYAAAPPVPESVLGWLTDMVAIDVWDRRGRNPQDPSLVTVKERYDQAISEIKEAADSKDGLFDLPIDEDLDTAVTTGGPLGYAEQSPYTWTDVEIIQGTQEDSNRGQPGTS